MHPLRESEGIWIDPGRPFAGLVRRFESPAALAGREGSAESGRIADRIPGGTDRRRAGISAATLVEGFNPLEDRWRVPDAVRLLVGQEHPELGKQAIQVAGRSE